jgi:hypothetical protein
MLASIQSILDEPWKPISRPALVGWLIFYPPERKTPQFRAGI